MLSFGENAVVSLTIVSDGANDSMSNFLDPGKVVLLEISYPKMIMMIKNNPANIRNIFFDFFKLVF